VFSFKYRIIQRNSITCDWGSILRETSILDIIPFEVNKPWGEFMAKVVTGKIGDKVVESGNYICMNCGHYQYFDANDEFEDCTTCGEPDIVWELE
jgi:hypothetical protein